MGNFIVNRIPDAWATTNPLRLGFGNTTRTVWSMGTEAAPSIALDGLAENPYWSGTQIATLAIDMGGANVAHNSSSAGSSNNYNLTPKLGSFTLA